ncbi:sulfotransferase domain-containing protein [Portibacter marinus]|uniref:sulfotransferase domain-containing protein n=1 Tax=Portibacter marinus TaxID=2898660 RepID=UPI001F291985|nr:sulfotransferase domain-containing protein [Portibacter marinus]
MKGQGKNHALVLGCGRSGTSIFGELFQDIGGFKYYSEPDMDLIMNLEISNHIAIKVPRETAKYPGKNGLSFPLDEFLDKFDHDVQVFWIVRNPLDTICSLKVGIARNWGHHPRPPDWQKWLSKPLVMQCAHHWNYINTVSYESAKSVAKTVHFEDMIRNSKSWAEAVLRHINLENPTIEHWAQRVQDQNNQAFVEAKTSVEYSLDDHSKRVGRWKENLNEEEVAMIWPMVRETASNFGYDLDA